MQIKLNAGIKRDDNFVNEMMPQLIRMMPSTAPSLPGPHPFALDKYAHRWSKFII